jgi:hypothetical protein
MQSVAAYYVLVATDLANEQRADARRLATPAPRRSRIERLTTVLETLFRFGSPTVSQPI